ncbi:hypothetical protein [Pseudoalteromonas sp. SWYJ118]|uniref:hypothetical protein n=1 Tax=Pseudoalteromonas sp. SWYJ118 TaxID=2792062 RepID=UPI001E61B521|nr:hypothetical protein [Pseudoalteromonas sp. SWYJ118]
MHDISKGSASPIVYLLTGYVKNNTPVGKLTPVANRIVIAEQSKSATYDTKKPVVLKTNSSGILSTINSDSLEVRQPFHAYIANNQRPIIIPPMESIGLIANNNPSGWAKEFVDNLKNYSSSNTPLLELQTVPVTNLKQPAENSEDDTYNKWYAKEITQKNVQTIQAYVLAKTRAIILSINPNIPLLSPGANIVLSTPEGRDIPATFDRETKLAVISGTNKILPKGLYRIKVRLDQDTYLANISNWCAKSVQSDDNYDYYELAEMIHFDIKNEAGEFDVINCDPLSVEEAIIKQFPRFYSHLISYAKDLKTEHATYDPKNISVKDENGKEIGRAKVSDEPIKIASGFESFCHG